MCGLRIFVHYTHETCARDFYESKPRGRCEAPSADQPHYIFNTYTHYYVFLLSCIYILICECMMTRSQPTGAMRSLPTHTLCMYNFMCVKTSGSICLLHLGKFHYHIEIII